ncbi:MAG: TrmH family RNA methyltransferase [Candidatus Spechtbacterales bacterium]
MIVVLNNIRSMHNVGSIFRTADAVGVEKIYLCGFTPSPLDEFKKVRPQIAKVALGAENNVSWEKHPKTHIVLDNLKKEGYKIFAVEQHPDSVPYNKIKLTEKQAQKIVVVFGHEINGISEAILKRADKILEIPMLGEKESLNVSVTFGIVVYALEPKLN